MQAETFLTCVLYLGASRASPDRTLVQWSSPMCTPTTVRRTSWRAWWPPRGPWWSISSSPRTPWRPSRWSTELIEEHSRKGKGRRCGWGGGGTELIQFLCRTTDLAPGWFEEMDELKNGHMAECMFRKNGWSSCSHHTKPPPSQNGCVCSPYNFSSNHPCC